MLHKNMLQNSHLPNLAEPVVLQQCDISFIQVNVPQVKGYSINKDICTILKILNKD